MLLLVHALILILVALIGAGGTIVAARMHGKITEIHVLVNSRHEEALSEIAALEAKLAARNSA